MDPPVGLRIWIFLPLFLLLWFSQGFGQDGSAKVRRVIDGDSVRLEDGREVRYVGINTPERGQAFFQEAKTFNRRLVEGKWVRMEMDQVLEDKYGRLLAYVYIDGEMVNERLIEAGLAHLLVIPPNLKYYDRLLDRQRQARSARRGMWQRLTGPLRITSLEADPPGDDRQNPNGEYVRIVNVIDEVMDPRGFTLTDRHGHRYIFPALSLEPGHSVLLFSGRGRDRTDSKEQIVLYWQSDGPIWNNEGDTATLRAPDGSLVDTFQYQGRPRSRKTVDRGQRVLSPASPSVLGELTRHPIGKNAVGGELLLRADRHWPPPPVGLAEYLQAPSLPLRGSLE